MHKYNTYSNCWLGVPSALCVFIVLFSKEHTSSIFPYPCSNEHLTTSHFIQFPYLIALPRPPRYITGMKPPNPPKAAAGTKYAPPPLPLKPRPLPRPLMPPLSVELTPGKLVLFSVTCSN